MKFKKVPIDILAKNDNDLLPTLLSLKWRQFAQSTEELKKHVFIAQIFWNKILTNPRTEIASILSYLRPNR